MIDIDHLKSVNDNFSHETGDAVLKDTANILKNTAHEWEGGCAGRWGGEEFYVILPHIGSEDAMNIAEDLRKRVENHIFPEVGHLTISLGVITIEGDTKGKDIYRSVDMALYDAKESGRNRIVKADI